MSRKETILLVCCLVLGVVIPARATILIQKFGAAAAGCASGSIGTGTINTADSKTSNRFYYSELPVSNFTPGQVTYCWDHVNNIGGGVSFTLGLYDSLGNILAYRNQATLGTTEAWQGGAMTVVGNTCLTAGATVYAGIVTQDTAWNQYRKTSLTGSNIKSIAMTYATTLANADFSAPTTETAGTAADFICNNTGVSP